MFCGENDLASTSSKQENDCCEQSQYSSNLKLKQQPINNITDIRNTLQNYYIIGFLTIHLIKNIIIRPRETSDKALPDILCINETKLDRSFPDLQFRLKGYQFTILYRERNLEGKDKMVFWKGK